MIPRRAAAYARRLRPSSTHAGTPESDDLFDLRPIVDGILGFSAAGEPGENARHVADDRLVDCEDVGQVEAAEAVRVPLREDEVRDTARLAGVAAGDAKKALKCLVCRLVHGEYSLPVAP